ncbi:MAG: alpha/beta hydrolase, partial [Dehalococcoidia bacterium]
MASRELAEVIELFTPPETETSPTLEESRAGFEELMSQFPVPSDVNLEVVDAGGVPSEWVVTPEADTGRVVLYLHGGGYVLGSIATHRAFCARLSKAAGARVLVIDYRLAPEHPYPAAVEDALTTYRWILSQGIDPARIVIGGDSAGGGLTVATLVALRDAGDTLPSAGVCLSPWVDMEGIGGSMTTKASVDPVVQKEWLLEAAATYLASAHPRTPLAAPLYADLVGLAPLLIQVG